MVRRKKPMPRLHKWKAKSRWCVHGHCDPDTGEINTHAPTPSSESPLLFYQVCANHDFDFDFTDIKNAFTQSRCMKRKRGPISVEPCDGLDLPEGPLIDFDVTVYGLDDVSYEWRETVLQFFVDELGYKRNAVASCWLMLHDEGTLVSQVLLEVDDFTCTRSEATPRPVWRRR